MHFYLKKIRVYVWKTIQKDKPKKKVALQPLLYLIFANSEEDTKMSLMTEIIRFAGQCRYHVIQTYYKHIYYVCRNKLDIR